jgi:hypothetical protein
MMERKKGMLMNTVANNNLGPTYPTQMHGDVPVFYNEAEEAAYWDTHTLVTDWDSDKPAVVRFAKNLTSPLAVRLDPETLEHLRQSAYQKGIGPTTLARMIIKERLQSDETVNRR